MAMSARALLTAAVVAWLVSKDHSGLACKPTRYKIGPFFYKKIRLFDNEYVKPGCMANVMNYHIVYTAKSTVNLFYPHYPNMLIRHHDKPECVFADASNPMVFIMTDPPAVLVICAFNNYKPYKDEPPNASYERHKYKAQLHKTGDFNRNSLVLVVDKFWGNTTENFYHVRTKSGDKLYVDRYNGSRFIETRNYSLTAQLLRFHRANAFLFNRFELKAISRYQQGPATHIFTMPFIVVGHMIAFDHEDNVYLCHERGIAVSSRHGATGVELLDNFTDCSAMVFVDKRHVFIADSSGLHKYTRVATPLPAPWVARAARRTTGAVPRATRPRRPTATHPAPRTGRMTTARRATATATAAAVSIVTTTTTTIPTSATTTAAPPTASETASFRPARRTARPRKVTRTPEMPSTTKSTSASLQPAQVAPKIKKTKSRKSTTRRTPYTGTMVHENEAFNPSDGAHDDTLIALVISGFMLAGLVLGVACACATRLMLTDARHA